MVCGIWCGTGKAPLKEYLTPLVQELKKLIEHGLQINEYHIHIQIGRFIGDTPARAFIKGKIFVNFLTP